MGRYKIRYTPYTPNYRSDHGLRGLDHMTPTEHDVVECLRGGVRLAMREICKRTGHSHDTCFRAVKRLYNRGLIHVYRAKGMGLRGSTTLLYELSRGDGCGDA